MADMNSLAAATANLSLANTNTNDIVIKHNHPNKKAPSQTELSERIKAVDEASAAASKSILKKSEQDRLKISSTSEPLLRLENKGSMYHEDSSSTNRVMDSVPRPFTFNQSLAKWDISMAEYLEANPTTHTLATGVAVVAGFTVADDLLLLVQRSPTDSFPNKWELPGGCVDHSDKTILEAAARELQEETGLTVSKFVGELSLTTFYTGRKKSFKWQKPTFVVEVHEAQSAVQSGSSATSEASRIGTKVKLDAKEHQAWVWATKDDIEQQLVGNTELYFVSDEQKMIMKEAFGARTV